VRESINNGRGTTIPGKMGGKRQYRGGERGQSKWVHIGGLKVAHRNSWNRQLEKREDEEKKEKK